MADSPAATTELFEQLADDFTAALRRGESPPIEAYARQHPQLADRIRKLFPMLAIMEQNASSGAADPPLPAANELKQLGDFRIDREIGRGGMGIVYQAMQQSLQRIVALKLLTQSPIDSRLAERFQQEARLAAMLHHTNIVPIYGIGEEAGYAYIVMQYIEGVGLDHVLINLQLMRESGNDSAPPVPLDDQSASSIASAWHSARETTRLSRSATRADHPHPPPSGASHTSRRDDYWQRVARVGWQVAEGLAHAHEQGILHRDIKPSNLLLDEYGAVWITDFGLARLADSSNLTRTGEVVGTLRYMSPEQFSGDSDARSDVYSLGLTLYELATLQPAFRETDPQKLVVQVTEASPLPPNRLEPRIPRDLETIILKSIAAEPSKRYGSAKDLAADLQRFLNQQPIKARRVSPMERMAKWSRRYPVVASLTATVILLTLVAIVGISWKWREADANFRRAQAESHVREIYFNKALEAVDQMLNRVGTELLANQPGTSQIRQSLLTDALRFYDDFLHASGDDPSIRAEIGRVHRRVGEIHQQLGDNRRARASLEKSQSLFSELHQAFPREPEYLLEMAAAATAIAQIELALGQSADAELRQLQAIKWLEQGQTNLSDPSQAETHRWVASLAGARTVLGTILVTSRNPLNAVEQFESADQLFARIPDAFMQDTWRLRHAMCLERLAQMYVDINRNQESLDNRTAALEILQNLVDSNPHVPVYRDTLANTRQQHSGVLARLGMSAEALKALTAEIADRETLIAQFGDLPDLRTGLARAYAMYGGLTHQAGNYSKADEAVQKAVDLVEELTQRFPDNVHYLVELGYVTQFMANNFSMRRRPEETELAIAWCRKAYEIRQRVTRLEPNNSAYQTDLATAARTYSAALFFADVPDPVIGELCQDAVTLMEQLVRRNPGNVEMLYQLAFTQTNLSRARQLLGEPNPIEPIESAIKTFLTLIERQPQDPRPRLQLTRAYDQLASFQLKLGQREGWEQTLRHAADNMKDTVAQFGEDPRLIQFLTISQNRLAHCLKTSGKTDEARTLFESALKRRQAELQSEPDSQRGIREVASAHRNLAWLHALFAEAPDLDLALEHATAALERTPEAIDAATALAYVQYRRGERESLKSTLDRLQRGDLNPPVAPEYAMVHLALRSLAAQQAGNPANAAFELSNALKLLESAEIQDSTDLAWRQPELQRVVHWAKLCHVLFWLR